MPEHRAQRDPAGVASRDVTHGESVVDSAVYIDTPDGTCDAAFIHPAGGAHPGVIVWSDAFGLRPVMREMGRRLAAEGYAVLVPNPFYRSAKAPVFEDPSSFDFGNQTDRARLMGLMQGLTAPGAAERDAMAFVAFLDHQPQVDRTKAMGTQGYCMGGQLAVRTAAAVPNRIGAGASFHGGHLVTDAPTSPHLLAPRIQARMYFAIASNDDEQQPQAKETLRQAFGAAHVAAEIEVYPRALHGWCMADMPARNGTPIFNETDAERAWAKLLALYKAALV